MIKETFRMYRDLLGSLVLGGALLFNGCESEYEPHKGNTTRITNEDAEKYVDEHYLEIRPWIGQDAIYNHMTPEEKEDYKNIKGRVHSVLKYELDKVRLGDAAYENLPETRNAIDELVRMDKREIVEIVKNNLETDKIVE